LSLSGNAQALFLGSPDTFQVNVNSSGAGTFGEVTLANLELDYSIELQRQFINDGELENASSITIIPGENPTARYTASVFDFPELSVQVDTVLLGPLRDVSGPNGYMRQILTVTNTGSAPTSIDSVSLYTPAFETTTPPEDIGGDETAQADPATGVVYAADGATTRFAAVGALSNRQFFMSYDVGLQGDLPTVAQDLLNEPGPVVADDTALAEMATGMWTSGLVGPGESVVMEFAYLFALDASRPPASFPAPAPASGALLAGALPLLLWMRSRRRVERVDGA
jgi:hypothetical protein